jgi:hypothetical protein
VSYCWKCYENIILAIPCMVLENVIGGIWKMVANEGVRSGTSVIILYLNYSAISVLCYVFIVSCLHCSSCLLLFVFSFVFSLGA